MRPALPAHRAILVSLLFAILAGSFARPVLGATQVEGGIDSIKLEARDASLAEVFAALSARAGVTIRLSNAPHQRVDGSFQGPLRWVVTRLLAGRNYIARYSHGAVDIVILGASGPPTNAATADQSPPTPVPTGGGRRTRNEGVSAAARTAPHTTGSAGGDANSAPRE